MGIEKSFFNSIRARMTLAFVLLMTTLLLLVGGGLLSYLHYTTVRSIETSWI